MTITAVEELTKGRSKIWIDEEFAFVLYKGELRRYHIRVGGEISQEDYDAILQEVLPKRAKLRAMNLLTKKDYTEKQLRGKLQEGCYPEQVIREALDYVAGYHYTDDRRYAVSYITDHENTRSRRRIEQDLLGRGIEEQVLEQAWAEWEAEGGRQDEQAMIGALMAKRRYDPDTADWKERRRMYAFLLRKGFSAEAVNRAMREACGEDPFCC